MTRRGSVSPVGTQWRRCRPPFPPLHQRRGLHARRSDRHHSPPPAPRRRGIGGHPPRRSKIHPPTRRRKPNPVRPTTRGRGPHTSGRRPRPPLSGRTLVSTRRKRMGRKCTRSGRRKKRRFPWLQRRRKRRSPWLQRRGMAFASAEQWNDKAKLLRQV